MRTGLGLGTLSAMGIALALFVAMLCLAGCNSPELAEPVETAPATETAEATPAAMADLGPAQYELVFDATWSAQTHPTDFPSNAHFSGLIGAVHKEGAYIWGVGADASPGMKNMAETGGKNPLDAEIETLIADGEACELISGDGVNPAPGVASVQFTVTDECPLVSVVTMIAPSPDWFVGVSSVDMREDGAWADEIVIEVFAWDAGTDSGSTYSAANAPTDPVESISLMPSEPPIEVDGLVPPFGTFTFTRVDG